MFSCFGFRARHKALTSATHSDVELRAPLAPKDGVPLNTHNHHHKHALYNYYNGLHRSSFNSSRRNSQASNLSGESSSKASKTHERRKSLDLAGVVVPANGLKITDIDANTTDIIKCNEESLIAVLKEDKSKQKSGKSKKKKKANSLPRSVSIKNVEKFNLEYDEKINNEKNRRISKLLNNNDFSSTRSIVVVQAIDLPIDTPQETSPSTPNSIPKFKKSSTKNRSTKSLKLESKKQALNRSLSPTDLDSFMHQRVVTSSPIHGENSNRCSSVSKIDKSPENNGISIGTSLDSELVSPISGMGSLNNSSVDFLNGCPSTVNGSLNKYSSDSKMNGIGIPTNDSSNPCSLGSNINQPSISKDETSNDLYFDSKMKVSPISMNDPSKYASFDSIARNGYLKNVERNKNLENGIKNESSTNRSPESKILSSPSLNETGSKCSAEPRNVTSLLPKIVPGKGSKIAIPSISKKGTLVQPASTGKTETLSNKNTQPQNGKIKTASSKLPYKKSSTKSSKSASKLVYPSSYTRLPIALDRKSSTPDSPNAQDMVESPTASVENPNKETRNVLLENNLNNCNEVSVPAIVQKNNLKNDSFENAPKSMIYLMNMEDSSIPLIDDTEDTESDSPPILKIDEGEKTTASLPSSDKHDSPLTPQQQLPQSPKAAAAAAALQPPEAQAPSLTPPIPLNEPPVHETAFRNDASTPSTCCVPDEALSPMHRDSFRRKRRKQDDPERDDDQPVKTARSTTKGVSAADAAELKRLEAALSAKSAETEAARREAEAAKSEATQAGRGVEALTVLVHHLTTKYEAFNNPHLKIEIARLQKCLQEAEQALGESRSELQAAETRLSEEKASAALQQEELAAAHATALQQLNVQHEQHLQELQQQHQEKLDELAKQHQGSTRDEQEKHRLEIVRLTEEHEKKVSDEKSQHAARELEMQARSTSLQKEHDKLREQSKKLQDSLLSDNDHRLTAVKNYCTGLQQEVDSLKSVVEMRNSELHKLRAQVTGMEQLERDLEAARQCAKTLQAKTEDLNAQMDAKAKAERQLLSSNRELLENMNRESSVNKQLRLENEELQWKLRQRELSTSLPISTLDLMTRVCHLNTSWEERPASLHHPHTAHREGQQSQVSKGAPRVENRHVTSSPANGRPANRSPSMDDKFGGRSTKAGDGESPPSSPCVKAVVEKSNSVSFILDLNDSLPDDNCLDFPPSPRLKHGTPTLTRKALQKSRSSSLDKKVGIQFGKNIALSKCTSAGNFFIKSSNSELRPCKDGKIDSKKDNHTFLEDQEQLCELSRRLHSTSESSGGADSENMEGSIERVSPSGLAWTVPVNGSSPTSPRSPRLSTSRDTFTTIGLRHLHQPEEDEYEENMEGSEDGFINGLHSDITPLVNLMNASSSSPSDSELSRCGSQAGLTSESDEESSLAEGDRAGDSLSPVAEVPWVGAGEAMIPSDLVVHCGSGTSANNGDQSNKDPVSKDVQGTAQAVPQLTTSSITDAGNVTQDWSEGKLAPSQEMQEM